jgi:predicted Rossmann-fold nucleotide-binding protein
MRRICVYCGSNKGARPDYAEAAEDLAAVLVEHRLELVYGGSSKGIWVSSQTRPWSWADSFTA